MLPAPLLQAISARPGGRVALIIGAGCSVEDPTNLPMAKAIAVEAHQRLLADSVLQAGECPNPEDLSSVAEAVFTKTGLQGPLVERMNPQRFQSAEPNQGYLLAAALLRENAIASLMTLNFDYAIGSALSQLGARDTVTIIRGPQDHSQMGLVNVIFLHRSAFSPFEDWILRTTALETGWQGRWEEVVASRVLTSPVTVFAGLGSPSRVLIETTRKIREAIPNGTNVYQVDPLEPDKSAFFSQLNIPAGSYVQLSWGPFMKELADRLLEQHRIELRNSCDDMTAAENIEHENTAPICERFVGLGLLGFGKLRARWMLQRTSYVTHAGLDLAWIANLLLAIALIERKTGTRAIICEDGIVELYREDQIVSTLIFAHGRGSKRWLSVEAALHTLVAEHSRRNPRPRRAVVAGVQGPRRPAVGPPVNIVPTESSSSILPHAATIETVDVEELRSDGPAVARLVANEP